MRLEARHSPCSITHPRRPHPCSHEHADRVLSYRLARHAWELAAEAATHDTPGVDGGRGESEELRAYREQNPPPSWRAFITNGRCS